MTPTLPEAPSEITLAWLNELKRDRREGREPDSAGRYSYNLPIKFGKEAYTVCVKISARYITLFADMYAANLRTKVGVDKRTGLPVYRRGQVRKATIAKFSVADLAAITSTEYAAIKESFKKARDEHAKVTPGKAKAEKKQAQRALMTNRELMALAFEFSEIKALRVHQRLARKRGEKESTMQYYVRRFFLEYPLAEPHLGAKTFGDIAPGDVDPDEAVDWLEKVRSESGFHTARLAQAYTRRLFKLLVEKKKLRPEDSFPMPPSIVNKSSRENEKWEREVELTETQLRTLWSALKDSRVKAVERDLIQFAMFSALRKSGAAEVKWEFVDWQERVIKLPPEANKGKRWYRLPLTPAIDSILRRRKEAQKDRLVPTPYIFPNGAGNAFDQVGRLYCKLDEIMSDKEKLSGGEDRRSSPFPWSLHCFRATAMSLLEGNEDTGRPQLASEIVQERVLDHKVQVSLVRKHYIKRENLAPLRAAFEALAGEILRICEPEEQKVAKSSVG